MLLRTALRSSPIRPAALTHAAIDAALDLRAMFGSTDLSRASIRIGLSPVAMKIVGERLPAKLTPRNTVDAQFSVYFQVAAAWLDGRVESSSCRAAGGARHRRHDGAHHRCCRPGHDQGRRVWWWRLDGSDVSRTVETPLGEPENPVGWDPLRVKFMSLAEPVYGAARAGDIADRVGETGPATLMRDIIGLAAGLRMPRPAAIAADHHQHKRRNRRREEHVDHGDPDGGECRRAPGSPADESAGTTG